MKPVSVRFKCFGPYMAEQYIDFRELEKNGLFLICGETGAGKTTILDAMCYALYGRSSGGLRGDIGVMRCKLAGKDDETLVEFVFDSNGKRYKFTRSLKYGRKKLNDSHNCLELTDGEYVPIFENPKATFVNHKAEELIGLTYDQFRQVIILPQGQFEKLLVSNSEDKEKILVSLFHADRWQHMAEEIARRVTERDNALRQEMQQITAKLKDYGCESLDVLTAKIAGQEMTVAQVQEQTAAAEAQAADCRTRHDAGLVEAQAFLELERRSAVLVKLTAQEAGFDREEGLLTRVEQADRIREPYGAYLEESRRKVRAEQLLRDKQKLLESAGLIHKKAREAMEVHEASRPEQEARTKKLALLEESRELYQTLADRKSAAVAAGKALLAAQSARKKAEQEFSARDLAWQNAMAEQNRIFGAYQQAQAVYLRGIGSVLAQSLEQGKACPVCGSTEHPAPAQPMEGHITEDALEELNRQLQAAGEAVTAAKTQRDRAEKIRDQAVEAWNLAAQREAAAARDWENARARKLEGIEDLTQLENQIRMIRKKIEEFAKADTRLTQALQDAAGDEKAAELAAATAAEEWTAAQTAYALGAAAWQEALSSAGFDTEESYTRALMDPADKQRRSEALIRFRTELAGAREALEAQKAAIGDRTAPDMEGLRTELTACEAAVKSLTARKALEEQRLQTMVSDEKKLRRRLEVYRAARLEVDEDLEFANRLRGRSGVSLQRYVLGVMLTSVAAEANRLLAKVYSGRYQLYRTDEVAGSSRKSGLELEVYDSHTNARRSVTTLSGGEKFLVALSLAIGLSTVVQAQGSGIRLEAMFIDEGFGSLDREAVADALEVLQGIQRSSGVVGIISHVEQLTETIPTRIEITKGKQGSTCRVIC